jgi:type IV pilus assembly protein PilV
MEMRNSRGFTIIEVLVSITIVTIGLLAAAAMQTTAITANGTARDGTIGIQLAEEMVDRIRINAGITPQDYNGIDTNGACGGADPVLGDCTQWAARLVASGLPAARGQVSVSAVDAPLARTRTVNVTVTWGNGTPRTVTFTTIVETWAS